MTWIYVATRHDLAGLLTAMLAKSNDALDIDVKDHSGSAQVVRILLAIGNLDIEARDKCRRTPFSCAVSENKVQVVKIFLDTAKVDINAKPPRA